MKIRCPWCWKQISYSAQYGFSQHRQSRQIGQGLDDCYGSFRTVALEPRVTDKSHIKRRQPKKNTRSASR